MDTSYIPIDNNDWIIMNESLTNITVQTADMFESINESTLLTTQPPASSQDQSFYCLEGIRLFRFITEVVISLPIEIFGVVGNILAFRVLYQQPSKVGTNLLLQGLALMDSLYLLFSIQLRAVRYFHSCIKIATDYDFYRIYTYSFMILYPVMYMVRLAGTWFTVWLTLGRWVAVCLPLHVQLLVTRRNVWLQILITTALSIVIAVPRYFEYQISIESTGYRIHPTSLLRNKVYMMLYPMTFFFLVMYLCPMSLLVILNLKLGRALKFAEKERESLRHPISGMRQNSSGGSSSANKSLTLIVVVVTATFLVCNIPPLISHFMYGLTVAFPSVIPYIDKPRRYMSNISNIMVTLNSAVNFIIYCVCSKNFRNSFAGMSHCTCAVRPHEKILANRKRAGSGGENGCYTSIKTKDNTRSTSLKSSTQSFDLPHNILTGERRESDRNKLFRSGL